MPTRREPNRDDRAPARRKEPTIPIHDGREFSFVDQPDREHWWKRLDPNARREMLNRVGNVIEWWAHFCGEPIRPYAVVFGRRGFALSRPDLNQHGRPSNRLLVWSLREASHRSVRVTGVSAGDVPDSNDPIARTPDRDRPDSPGTPATTSLPEPIRGFLGNLPDEAQQRLQEPFVSADLIRESDYYYFGYPERLDVWCCLAGSRTITFASGTGVLIPGRQRAYSWDLACRQAQVVGSD